MAKKNLYRDYIPWSVLENHLLMLRQNASIEMATANGLQEVGKAQGKVLAYNGLLNLPEVLMMREDTELTT